MSDSFIDDLEQEDTRLHEHISKIRSSVQKLKPNEDPMVIINNDKALRILFSETILDIKRQYNDIKQIADELFSYTENTKILSEGKKPYLFSDCERSTDVFSKMNVLLDNTNKKAEEISYNIEDIEKSLVKIRRLYESIIVNV
jgi:hypothetical protein